MAISRTKTWVAAEVLTAGDLNAEFNGIIDNALSLISPLTGNLNVNNNQLTNLRVENLTTDPTANTNAGRIWFRTDTNSLRIDTGDGGNQDIGVTIPLSVQVFS